MPPNAEKLMDAEESPAAVVRLLGLLEGVEVQNVWQRGLEVTLRVRVASIDSRSALVPPAGRSGGVASLVGGRLVRENRHYCCVVAQGAHKPCLGEVKRLD